MKEIIIHVGPYKTGTSYIQKKLKDINFILNKHNIYYPTILLFNNAHHPLIDQLKKGISPEDISSNLRKKLPENYQKIILSSEKFSLLDTNNFEKLLNIFPNHKFTFILYIRTPSIRFISFWQERIKFGYTDSFFKFFNEQTHKGNESKYLNYDFLIKKITKLFGEGSIKLIDYESSKNENRILNTFFKASNIKLEIVEKKENINEMIPFYEIELLRYINLEFLKNNTKTKPYEISNKYFISRHFLTHDLLKFKNLISKYLEIEIFGNYIFDKEITNIYNTKYYDLIIDSVITNTTKKYILINENWIKDQNLKELANEIYKKVISYKSIEEYAFYLAQIISKKNLKEVSIFGTGRLASLIAKELIKKQIKINSFILSNPKTNKFQNITLYSTAEAVKKKNITNIVIASIGSCKDIKTILSKYKNINTFTIFENYP